MIHLLLENKANVNHARASDGSTPLHLAVQHGGNKVVGALLMHDANVNHVETSDGMAPLVVALLRGSNLVSTILLKKMLGKASLLMSESGEFIALPANQTIYSSVIAALNHDALKAVYERRKDLRKTVRSWLVGALSDRANGLMQKSNIQVLKAEIEGMRAMLAEVALLKSKGLMGHEKQAVKDIKKLMVMLQMMLPLEEPEAGVEQPSQGQAGQSVGDASSLQIVAGWGTLFNNAATVFTEMTGGHQGTHEPATSHINKL